MAYSKISAAAICLAFIVLLSYTNGQDQYSYTPTSYDQGQGQTYAPTSGQDNGQTYAPTSGQGYTPTSGQGYEQTYTPTSGQGYEQTSGKGKGQAPGKGNGGGKQYYNIGQKLLGSLTKTDTYSPYAEAGSGDNSTDNNALASQTYADDNSNAESYQKNLFNHAESNGFTGVF